MYTLLDHTLGQFEVKSLAQRCDSMYTIAAKDENTTLALQLNSLLPILATTKTTIQQPRLKDQILFICVRRTF